MRNPVDLIAASPGGVQPAEVTINYYDQTGRLLGSQLPDGTYTTNSYYPTGWLAASSGSRTYAVGYSYDGQGRMKTMTNWGQAGAEVTTWSYDPYRGWLTSKLDNSGHGPAYTRTAAGRLKTRTWARGTNTSYAYNQAGALAKTTYSDGTPAVGNGYDRRGRLNGVTNGAMVTMRTFNDAGEVLSETYVGGLLDGLSVVSIYDGLLRRTNVAVWTNVALWSCTNNYDAASRLLTVSDGTNAAAYSYVANSPLVDHITFAHGGTTEMTTSNLYDYLNRRTQVANANGSGAALDLHGYAYNAANQRTSATNADGSYWVYGYDALGQVTNGVKKWANNNLVAGEQFGYGFDTIGNRTKTLAGGDQNGAGLRQASYTANALNQYTGRTVPGAVDVIGSVTNTGSVWVNQIIPYRTNNYFWEALPVTNGPGPVYQYEKKVEESSHFEISIAGVDIPIISTVISATRGHYVVKAYGCCQSCGFWHKNTTSWNKSGNVLTDTSNLASPSFGPVRADIGMTTTTTTETKWRKCVNGVTPLTTTVDDDLPPYPGGF